MLKTPKKRTLTDKWKHPFAGQKTQHSTIKQKHFLTNELEEDPAMKAFICGFLRTKFFRLILVIFI